MEDSGESYDGHYHHLIFCSVPTEGSRALRLSTRLFLWWNNYYSSGTKLCSRI